jgi:hypothetical protein
MQRVRVGLTGLAFVFLLLVVAAAGMRPDRSVAPAGAQGETLALLGVAPRSDDRMLRRSAHVAAENEQPRKLPTQI